VWMGLAACGRDLGNCSIQPLAIGIDGSDAPAFPSDDVGGGPPDAARRRRNQGDLALETHDLAPSPLFSQSCLTPCILRGSPARVAMADAPLICACGRSSAPCDG